MNFVISRAVVFLNGSDSSPTNAAVYEVGRQASFRHIIVFLVAARTYYAHVLQRSSRPLRLLHSVICRCRSLMPRYAAGAAHDSAARLTHFCRFMTLTLPSLGWKLSGRVTVLRPARPSAIVRLSPSILNRPKRLSPLVASSTKAPNLLTATTTRTIHPLAPSLRLDVKPHSGIFIVFLLPRSRSGVLPMRNVMVRL